MTAIILPDIDRSTLEGLKQRMPWLAAAIGLAVIVGAVVAVLTWGRRPGWSPATGSGLLGATDQTDTGIDVTAAYGEPSIPGTPDFGIDETDFAIDAGPSPFEEPRS